MAVQKIIVAPDDTEFWDTAGPDNETAWRRFGHKLAEGLAEEGTLPPAIETLLLQAFQNAGFAVVTYDCTPQ